MADGSFSERQEDELQVLQAIFMSDVVDLREHDAWKTRRPPELRLTLKPQQSVGNDGAYYNQVDLHVKCPTKYPEQIPEVSLENAKGLSDSQLQELQKELTDLAIRNKGEVMLLEIAQHVQQFLHANNKPPGKSFYEEMMLNKQKREQLEAEENQRKLEMLKRKEQKELQVLESEIQRRQSALKEETKKQKEVLKQPEEPPTFGPATPTAETVMNFTPVGTPGTPHKCRTSVSPSPMIVRTNSEPVEVKPRRQRRTSTPCRDMGSDHICRDHTGGIVVLAFNTKSERTIHRGTCLGHGSSGNTVYVGIDTMNGELVTISEWVLKWRHCGRKKLLKKDQDDDLDKEASGYLKQINSIEQELLSLIRLQHHNLIHYLAFKYQQDPGKITVYLMMEYCSGSNFSVNIRRNLPVHLAHLKTYTEEILHALAYLHNKDVVHKNLRPSSIFLDATGRIRITDYSIERRLSDLYYTVEQTRPGVHFDDNRPVPSKATKKGDVYRLGQLLLSLSIGAEVDDYNLDIPTHFPASFQDFLTKCLLKDDRTRWSVHQLLDHSFIKSVIPIHISTTKPEIHPDKNVEAEEFSDEEQPLITPYEASGHSRLTNEFEVLKSLGKGGFGDVIKVRNKLDRRFYAIKRIPLNPKSKQFNKKITREVKLLSRLNHENVVRYFNSWIETSDDPAHSESSSSLSTTPKSTPKTGESRNSLDLTDNIEKFAPQKVEGSVEWSLSYAAVDPDWDSDEDEADVFGTSFLRLADMSEDVVFIHSLDNEDIPVEQNQDNLKNKCDSTDEDPTDIPKLQYLYIQMEYCEKSTLRNCIDAGLYRDVDRVWRLFREIIDGLVHIHDQGMIHRDLKPVNIFLDSNDHVKIGDFGLATTSIMNKSNMLDTTSLLTCSLDHIESSQSENTGDGNLTGKVGTALYVSPEMMTGAAKIVYSQKVDLYSLGIIFFEMCYKPLPTGMERVKVLGNLRLPEIKFPEDFDQYEMENQVFIIKWLLNHDPLKRASTKELLQSDHLPPPQMEEAELDEILRSTIADPHSKAYRRMLSVMFSQTINAADDLLFDSEIYKGNFSMRVPLIHQSVQDTMVKVFQRHGAIRVSTPLFMPMCDLYTHSDLYTRFMDHSGHLVSLPFDLRIPFVRYVARYNCTHLKRYSIEKVYREKKVYGQHPRELTECAFDIITPNLGSLIPDVEVILIVQEIITEFQLLQQRSYYIRINHISILHAILLHCGVPDNLYNDVLHILSGVKVDSQSKTHIKSLSTLGLNDQTISLMLSIMEIEGSRKYVASYLRCITKTKGEVIVTLGLVYNPRQYSGMIFQIMADTKKKKRNAPDILAAGGRYDNLIKKFASPLTQPVLDAGSSFGVGVSIAFEKIAMALLENRELNPPSPYDILVCSIIGRKDMDKERMAVVRELWAAGLRAEIHPETLQAQEDIQEFCRITGVQFMVVLYNTDGESGIKVRSIERDKISEKKLQANTDLVDYLQQKLQTAKQEQSEPSQASTTKSSVISNMPESNQSSYSNNLLLSFHFVVESWKLTPGSRKKFESQISAKVSASLPWLLGKTCDVIALEMTGPVLKCLSAYLEVGGSEEEYESSINVVMEKLQRYRKYINKICDQIFELKFNRKCMIIILYGLKDDSVKLLT